METSKEALLTIRAEALKQYAASICWALGIDAEKSALVADSLVAANLRGVDSHGVQLLIWYAEQIERRNIAIDRVGRVVSESGPAMLYDAENALGQVVSRICCDHASRLADQFGIAFVTVRNSNHFGAAAYWAQAIADRGHIAIVLCNASPLVAPWQGRERRIGTNPICMAVPGVRRFLLDMATTTVALNRIYKMALSGETTIPEGWAQDAEGRPTRDVQEALKGFPMPLGGYKGYGLAMMVEILCAVLSGGAIASEVGGIRIHTRQMRVGHAFLAINPERFLPREEFDQRMARLIADVKSAAPAEGFHEVLVAGDPEWREEQRRLRDGIPVTRGIWEQIAQLAIRLGVAVPEFE
jgi:LDH2 family malate/lactate/ureidoglycolate dehydrogenase